MKLPHAFCHACGTAYAQVKNYPRTCPNPACGTMTWANPIPVVVVLTKLVDDQTGDTGLLVVRRGIDPGRGLLALPGGFVEAHETWQQAAQRETFEETGAKIIQAALRILHVASTEPVPNRILIFAEHLEPVQVSDLPPFCPNQEATERGMLRGSEGGERDLAFPLHARHARAYLGMISPHRTHQYIRI